MTMDFAVEKKNDKKKKHSKVENKIYSYWEKKGLFKPRYTPKPRLL